MPQPGARGFARRTRGSIPTEIRGLAMLHGNENQLLSLIHASKASYGADS